MKISLVLDEEDVRKMIVSKLDNECAKHGHPSDTSRTVVAYFRGAAGEAAAMPLSELRVSIRADVEVK